MGVVYTATPLSLRKGCKRKAEEVAALATEQVASKVAKAKLVAEQGLDQAKRQQEEGGGTVAAICFRRPMLQVFQKLVSPNSTI